MTNSSKSASERAVGVRKSAKPTEPLFDVIAVNIETGAERFIGQKKTERNASVDCDDGCRAARRR